MKSQEWLKAAGERYLHSMRADELVFLIEVEVEPEERADLLYHLARSHQLPWTQWAHACVAVAAVHVAREASSDETSLPRLFLAKLGIPYNQQIWENGYGKRIELIIHQFFPDDYSGCGAYRYVGPVYRHVGIPPLAVKRFGQLVRELLQKYGRSFTRQEYESARNHISGFASQFLASEHGYNYARNAVRILNRIDLGQIHASELDSITGYRQGFWAEVVDAAGKNSPAHGGNTLAFNDPYLALGVENGHLELRFDWRGVKKGIYRLNGRIVANASVNVSLMGSHDIQVDGHPFFMARWWSPGQTKFALFRASDGGFVTSGHGAPAGSYYLVCADGLTPPEAWTQEEIGYLGDSEYRIWSVVFPAGATLDEFGLHISGSAPAPEIEFAHHRRHSLGGGVFEGSLPKVHLRNWDEANARRYWIIVDDGSHSHPLDVPVGQQQIAIPVACPSAGTIRVEPRGLARQESALSTLRFAVVPPGMRIAFTRPWFVVGESAFAKCSVAPGWKPSGNYKLGPDGRWEISAHQSLLEGSVSNGVLKLSFSLRVPRLSIRLVGPTERLWWEGTQPAPRGLNIEAPPDFPFSVVLVGDNGSKALTDSERTGTNGMRLIPSAYFADALKLTPCVAGEFAMRLVDGALISSGDFFARAEEIKQGIEHLPDSALAFKLPVVGPALRFVRNLPVDRIASFPWSLTPEFGPLTEWLATLAYCAHVFDETDVPDWVEKWASQTMRSICNWYIRAGAHTETGATSAQLLKDLPPQWVDLAVMRWRASVQAAIGRLGSQADVQSLVREWRAAVKRQDGTAIETGLGTRPGGRELCEGARQYLIAMTMQGVKARNQSLVKVIGELEKCRSRTDCIVIRGVAATLLEEAYERSGRPEEVTMELSKERERAGLTLSDVSPLEKQNGNSEPAITGTVERCRASVPKS